MKGKNENHPRGAGGTLQMKIIAGHLLLVLLVGGIIGTVWYEHRMLRRAGKAERTMLEQRRLSNTAFKSLIAMFLDNERLLLRDKDDPALYGEREAQVAASLDRLRESYPNPVQRARIDTVKALLGERRHQVGQSAGISAPLAGEARIAAVSDSLKMCNRVLDGNINRLVNELEEDSMRRAARRQDAVSKLRTGAFHAICLLAAACIVCVGLLYIVVRRDLKRRQRYQRKLERSDRRNRRLTAQRKEMVASITHDLRAPLAAIRGCAVLLPSERDECRRNEHLENILHCSEHVLALVDTLMEYCRMDADGVRFHKTAFDLGTLFRETADGHLLAARQKGLAFTTRFTGLDVTVRADRAHIRQIACNLLTNAVKFTGRGEIRLEAEYSRRELRFSVTDTGMGMDEAGQKRIFSAFERLENARGIPGFGLGLAITARLVSEMRGRVEVESTPGEGSRFSVFLPVSRAGRPPRPLSPMPPAGIRVLVMDDDRIQLGITREMLSRNRIHCDCCRDVRELLACLEKREYDLLLTDIQMPETDGHAVLALLRNSNPGQSGDMPVLAVTARADKETEQLKKDGFAGFLHKPFSMDELLAAVAECTDGRTAQRKGPDFAALLDGEDDRKEILEMFVQDAERTTAGLRKAIEDEDYPVIAALIHKGAPLWETIQINIPAAELERLASLMPEAWDEAAVAEVWKLITAIEEAVEKAGRLKGEME